MPHICLDCFNTYDSDLMNKAKVIDYGEGEEWTYCPNTKCNGKVIEVDELILLTIKILNQKGYYTKYCCSGHVYDNIPNCYIMFDKDVELPNLPTSFIKEKFGLDNNIIIRKMFNEINEVKLFKEINKTSIVLLDWAKRLNNRY